MKNLLILLLVALTSCEPSTPVNKVIAGKVSYVSNMNHATILLLVAADGTSIEVSPASYALSREGQTVASTDWSVHN